MIFQKSLNNFRGMGQKWIVYKKRCYSKIDKPNETGLLINICGFFISMANELSEKKNKKKLLYDNLVQILKTSFFKRKPFFCPSLNFFSIMLEIFLIFF